MKHTGWIGLLSCSSGTDTELVGIMLFPPVPDATSDQRVGRVDIWRNELSYHSVIVGPRVAARSVLQKVIIVPEEEGPRSRGYFLGCQKIVVNESQAFRGTGYHIRNGTGLNVAENRGLWQYSPSWDLKNMLLTIEDKRISKDLLKFCFESQRGKSRTTFTLFLRTASKSAIVRRGSSFSKEDLHSFYDLLNEKYQDKEIVLTDSKTEPFRVAVTINEIAVYGWRIFEVNINAQHINPSLSI
tara:strand:- start:2415 stop:3140 length:726 start_codon:yes stop_codon:yes gene_type:complete